MAYTTKASWDFRTTSGATARASRVGSYTLTGSGNLASDGASQWTANGVDLSASTSDRLTLTLPTELKIGFVWIIGGFTQLSGASPAGAAWMFGLTYDTASTHLGTAGFAKAPNDGCYFQVRFGGNYDATGNMGTMSATNNYTAHGRKTALGVNNPAFKAQLNANSYQNFGVYNAGVEYDTTAQLVFGNRNSENARIRMAWFAMGDGDITDAELTAIAADPSLVLGGGTASNAPRSMFYALNGMR